MAMQQLHSGNPLPSSPVSPVSSMNANLPSTAAPATPSNRRPLPGASPPVARQQTQLSNGTLPHGNAVANPPQTSTPAQLVLSTSTTATPPASGTMGRQSPGQPRSLSRPFLSRLLRPPPRRTASTRGPPEWLQSWLRWWALLLLLAATISLAVAILTLAILSNNDNGIVTIRNSSPGRKIAGVTVGLSLTWKQIPVFVFQSYSLWVTATVYAYAKRQPFVELLKENGAPAKISVLLDYMASSGPSNIWRAFRNKHFLLCLLFFMNLMLAFVVTPFAANLFDVDNNHTTETTIDISRTTFFDQGALEASTQLLPMLTYVTGIQLYDTPLPSWTDQTYSFAPFEAPPVLAGGVNSITVEQNATFLDLSCRELVRGSDYNVLDTPSKNQWNITGSDRGCGFSQLFSHVGIFENYAQTFAANDCPLNFPSSGGRIFLFAAYVADGNASATRDFHLISCTTTYYNQTGKLEVALDASGLRPVIRNFTSMGNPSAMEPRPLFWKLFEKTINELKTQDTTATWSATLLGRLVVENAAQNATISEAYQPSRLIPSLESSMRLIYAVTVTTYLRSPVAAQPALPTVPGILDRHTNVLRMVGAIAYPFFGILVANAGLVFLLGLSIVQTRSILYEEPAGILSYAVLAAHSDHLKATAEALRDTRPDGKCIQAYRKGTALPGEYVDSRWAAKDWHNVSSGKIEKVAPGPTP